MRKLLFIVTIAVFLTFAFTIFAADRELAPLTQRRPGQPILNDRQGWLTISNRDWVEYYLTMDVDNARIMLDRQNNGGTRIASGGYLVVPLDRAMWEVVGDSDRDMVEVRIRPGQEAELALVPTGTTGNAGLAGVVMNDGQRRTGTLFGVGSAGSASRVDPAAMQRGSQVPAAARAQATDQTGRYSLPAFGLDRYTDPRAGVSAGRYQEAPAAVPSQNFHQQLYGDRARPRSAPDIVGDVLNELNDGAVDSITTNRR